MRVARLQGSSSRWVEMFIDPFIAAVCIAGLVVAPCNLQLLANAPSAIDAGCYSCDADLQWLDALLFLRLG